MAIDFDGLKNIANCESVDQAADFAKSRFGDHADKIDEIADRAKTFLGGDARSEQPSGPHDDSAPDGSVLGDAGPTAGNPQTTHDGDATRG